MADEGTWKKVAAILAVVAIVSTGLAVVFWFDLGARNDSIGSLEAERRASDALIKLSSQLQGELSLMERIALNAASELRGQDLNGTQARGVLTSCLSSHDLFINALTTDAAGTVLAVEPSEYSDFEGTDVSADPFVSELLATGRSYMSPLTSMYRGYGGVVIAAPVLNNDNEIAGLLNVMFRPDHLIENLTAAAGLGNGLNAMVLQKDGIILYDVDPTQVGKDTFHDPMFANFTEIKAAASRMANETSGTALYSFRLPGADDVVSKKVAWTTVGCLGQDWTVAVNRAA